MAIDHQRKISHLALCLAYFLCSHLFLQAQEETKRYLTMGLSPFGLLDPITPSLNMAAEISLSQKISLELGYGLDLNVNLTDWHESPEFRHHKYWIGSKYFIDGHDGNFPNTYLGLSFFKVINDYEKSDGSFLQTDVVFSYETAFVERRINGMRFKLGREIQPWDPILVDFFIGLGISHLRIDYFSDNFFDGGEWPIDSWLRPFDWHEGRFYQPDAQIGIKISYLISKP